MVESGRDSCWKDVYLCCAFLNWFLFVVSLFCGQIAFILTTYFLLCLFVILYATLALQTFMDAFSKSDDEDNSNQENPDIAPDQQHENLNICVQRC